TIILEVAEKFTNGMNKVMMEKSSSVLKIQKIIELHIGITINYSEGMATLNNDWMHLNDTDRKEFIKMREQYEESFRQIIKQGIKDQEIQPRHPEVILFSILSTLRTLYLWYQKRGKLDANILKKDMVEVFLNGIVNK
ncbi:MAG: TetR/AcrR family transcriptional regulator, partial [Flavobacteriaceae bacterium]|nr:TetR/AcrR family transcriptional regulator [Flavobacteriaceae bacterium]